MTCVDLARLELNGLLGTFQPLKPGGVQERERDVLRPIQVVRDDHGNTDLVATRQRNGQVKIHEEGLKDTNCGLRGTELSLGGYGARGEVPGGYQVSQLDIQRCLPVVIGDQFGTPQ